MSGAPEDHPFIEDVTAEFEHGSNRQPRDHAKGNSGAPNVSTGARKLIGINPADWERPADPAARMDCAGLHTG